jgi:hypothetical protein
MYYKGHVLQIDFEIQTNDITFVDLLRYCLEIESKHSSQMSLLLSNILSTYHKLSFDPFLKLLRYTYSFF